MSAIPCASVSLKTMADGTLRISFDVEPVHAQDAFRLFAAPGTPAALAALKVGYEQASDTPTPAKVGGNPGELGGGTPAKQMTNPGESIHVGGALAQLAGQWCADRAFQKWIFVDTEAQAAEKVRAFCKVDSRRLLDHDPEAAQLFHDIFRGPYMRNQPCPQ